MNVHMMLPGRKFFVYATSFELGKSWVILVLAGLVGFIPLGTVRAQVAQDPARLQLQSGF